MLIEVTCSELRNAASAIAKANEEFLEAAKAFKAAADELMGTWEGDSRDVFAGEMEGRNAWYQQMSQIVSQYVQMMNTTAGRYEEMDQQGAQIIHKK